MIKIFQIAKWILGLAFLTISVVAGCALGLDSTESLVDSLPTTMSQADDKTFIIDIVPLHTQIATEFIIDEVNGLQVFRYESSRLMINEVRSGKLINELELANLRLKLDQIGRGSINADANNLGALEDSQFSMIICSPAKTCRILAGALASASSDLREVIKSLQMLAGDMIIVRDSAFYLRCLQTPDKQWASIERRKTYRLTDVNQLPEIIQRVVDRSLSPAGGFQALTKAEAQAFRSLKIHGQLFIRSKTGIFGCESYSTKIH